MLCETISAETPQMIAESAKHFSHRKGKELGNKQKRLADIQSSSLHQYT
jgi:hypothetical protein